VIAKFIKENETNFLSVVNVSKKHVVIYRIHAAQGHVMLFTKELKVGETCKQLATRRAGFDSCKTLT
jgi:hypothetical protein